MSGEIAQNAAAAVLRGDLQLAPHRGRQRLRRRWPSAWKSWRSSSRAFSASESAREGLGITVGYFRSLEDIAAWKRNVEHAEAQRRGAPTGIRAYRVRIAKVEREYGFGGSELSSRCPSARLPFLRSTPM